LGNISIITGGSSGIGLGIVKHIIEQGGKALILDIFPPPIKYLNSYIAVDVTDHLEVINIIEKICLDNNEIDYVINCAGINGSCGSSWNIPMEDFKRVFDVNFFAACNLIASFIKNYRKNNQARFINVASHLGLLTRSDISPYTSSKHALLSYSECLQADLIKKGLHHYKVHVFVPFFVKSKIYETNRYGYTYYIEDSSISISNYIKDKVSNAISADRATKILFDGIQRDQFYISTDTITKKQYTERSSKIINEL
jgi:NAD(P)-dependent dehydrogenase (short-subunit alcohol dehydrogenase family)